MRLGVGHRDETGKCPGRAARDLKDRQGPCWNVTFSLIIHESLNRVANRTVLPWPPFFPEMPFRNLPRLGDVILGRVAMSHIDVCTRSM